MCWLAALALVLAVLDPVVVLPPVQADESASAATALLLLQAGDDLTSRSVMVHGGYERDPLARGLVRSNWGIVVGTLVANAGARLLFRRAPHVIEGFAGIEATAIVNNARVLSRFR
jgi:hypothetical protein